LPGGDGTIEFAWEDATAFTVTTYFISDGSVTILLGEDPVLEKVE
jgi:hypothetical protein